MVSGQGLKGGKGGDLNIVGGIAGDVYGRGGDVMIDGGHSETGVHGQVKIGQDTDEIYMGELDYSSDMFFYGHSFAFGALTVRLRRLFSFCAPSVLPFFALHGRLLAVLFVVAYMLW